MLAYIHPDTGAALTLRPEGFYTDQGQCLPFRSGVYHIAQDEGYTESFGFQWNRFERTQIDRFSKNNQSEARFFTVTGWPRGGLADEQILEVGAGAGRFTQVVLAHTQATLHSVDYSRALEANYRNNAIYGERLRLFQASIYALPFAPQQFDKVFCFGVLQHTPDVGRSVACLAAMVKPGGELVVDFYPIRGWWTKLHAKYLLRPWAKRLSHEKLLNRIERHAPWMIRLSQTLHRIGLGMLTRFVPICDLRTLPAELSREQLLEWVILDTFDMFSPQYDQPQRIETVARWMTEAGLEVVQAEFVSYTPGGRVAVVRGQRRKA
ncbi:class I SAM-dependent methyltransferase [Eisenibacter elegans]|uniref:class I SAM-dependent methyltransferase n=1 Tax=Eisenibacter elegans TaxID=997 RepID=UPI00040C5587|nr:class I SAM-dependent methyltransferase [Eisenibacter elegans]